MLLKLINPLIFDTVLFSVGRLRDLRAGRLFQLVIEPAGVYNRLSGVLSYAVYTYNQRRSCKARLE